MKYFIVCGEASGDLHASHLITALRERDRKAQFRFFGGDLMAAAAGTRGKLLRYYKQLAYMGFIQVLLHARTILKGLQQCKAAIREWQPDCVILVDYPAAHSPHGYLSLGTMESIFFSSLLFLLTGHLNPCPTV